MCDLCYMSILAQRIVDDVGCMGDFSLPLSTRVYRDTIAETSYNDLVDYIICVLHDDARPVIKLLLRDMCRLRSVAL